MSENTQLGKPKPFNFFFSLSESSFSGFWGKQLKNTPEVSTGPCIFFSHLYEQHVTEQHELQKLVLNPAAQCQVFQDHLTHVGSLYWVRRRGKCGSFWGCTGNWVVSVQWLLSSFPWLTMDHRTAQISSQPASSSVMEENVCLLKWSWGTWLMLCLHKQNSLGTTDVLCEQCCGASLWTHICSNECGYKHLLVETGVS